MTCAKQTTRATIVAPDGRRFVGENNCLRPQAKCPREGMATGVGYELCKSICQQTGHAEANACSKAGQSARGGVLYLEGHYYACESCQAAARSAGVSIVIGPPPPDYLAELRDMLAFSANDSQKPALAWAIETLTSGHTNEEPKK